MNPRIDESLVKARAENAKARRNAMRNKLRRDLAEKYANGSSEEDILQAWDNFVGFSFLYGIEEEPE